MKALLSISINDVAKTACLLGMFRTPDFPKFNKTGLYWLKNSFKFIYA